MKRLRQQGILQIVGTGSIATQQELASELAQRGIAATQSSISRDIVDLGLTKVDGHYVVPAQALSTSSPVLEIDSAGHNLIVLKTQVGQAQPVALKIDRAAINQIVGTVAGDDTIFIAVKDEAAQRAAIKRVVKLFAKDGSSA